MSRDFPHRCETTSRCPADLLSLLKPYLPGDARFHELANIIDVPYAPPVDVAANRALVVVGRLDAEKGVELAAQTARAPTCPLFSWATDRCVPRSRRPGRA